MFVSWACCVLCR